MIGRNGKSIARNKCAAEVTIMLCILFKMYVLTKANNVFLVVKTVAARHLSHVPFKKTNRMRNFVTCVRTEALYKIKFHTTLCMSCYCLESSRWNRK